MSSTGPSRRRVGFARRAHHAGPLSGAIVAERSLPDGNGGTISILPCLRGSRTLRQVARPGRLVVVSAHDEGLVPLADGSSSCPRRILEADGELVDVALEAGQALLEQAMPPTASLFATPATARVDLTLAFGPGSHLRALGPAFGLARSTGARATRPTRPTGSTAQQFRERVGADGFGKVAAGLE